MPKRVAADSSAEKPAARRTRTRRTSGEGSARSAAAKANEREYKLQVPAPDSPPFLTKADFDRERAARDQPATPAAQQEKTGA